MTTTDQTIDADVLVAGGGPAGLIAAIEAADAGARVVLIEALAELGGSGAKSAGHLALAETELAPWSREELLADIRHAHHDDHDEALARAYVDASAATYVRLKEIGVRYTTVSQLAHMTHPWAHEVAADEKGGRSVIEKLEAAARQRGVEILTSHRLRRLTTDAFGRVDGAVALRESDGAEVHVSALRGVVLATGGFTRNPEIVRNYGAESAGFIVPLTGDGSRGDGLIAALAVGAGTTYMHAGITPTASVEPTTGQGTLMFYCGGILLNKKGERFVDESSVYNDISGAGLLQPEGLMIHIFDQKARDDYAETIWGRVDALNGAREHRADTLDELFAQLADETGMDASAARATLDAYNAGAVDGRDETFGRAGLVGTAGDIRPIDQGPYYAIVTRPGTTHFNGGVTVDANGRVHNVFGTVIDGLYAAGEIMGGFHGAGYLSGTQWGQAVIFGRLAGLAAAGSDPGGSGGASRSVDGAVSDQGAARAAERVGV